MGSLTICIDLDKTSFSTLFGWFIVLGIAGFLTYLFFTSSSTEEIRQFTGANFIKNKFGIDLAED
jgi:hypothetical protein